MTKVTAYASHTSVVVVIALVIERPRQQSSHPLAEDPDARALSHADRSRIHWDAVVCKSSTGALRNGCSLQ